MPARPKSITHFQLDPAQPPMLTPEARAQLDARPIDYSDIPELPDDFWTQHPPVKREKKRIVTLRLDADVLTFFQTTWAAVSNADQCGATGIYGGSIQRVNTPEHAREVTRVTDSPVKTHQSTEHGQG